jgi:hypothetical protein
MIEIVGHDGISISQTQPLPMNKQKKRVLSVDTNIIHVGSEESPTKKVIRPCKSFQDLEHECNVFR